MNRITQKMPVFFKKLRNFGLTLSAVGAVFLAPPVGLPLIFASLGGYLLTAGACVAAVSQLTKEGE